MYRTVKYLNFYVWCSYLFQLNHVHDSFLALTTDGINFIMNSQEICDVINQCHDPKEAALRISEQVRWHCYTALFFHRKSCDFLTTVYNKHINVCCLNFVHVCRFQDVSVSWIHIWIWLDYVNCYVDTVFCSSGSSVWLWRQQHYHGGAIRCVGQTQEFRCQLLLQPQFRLQWPLCLN